MKYQCTAACANPKIGYFNIGDIVEDEATIDILKKDGQIQHFTTGKPQAPDEDAAPKADQAAPRAAVMQKKKG